MPYACVCALHMCVGVQVVCVHIYPWVLRESIGVCFYACVHVLLHGFVIVL